MCFRPPSFEEMMKKCPNCATFNAPELVKCKKCGTDLPEAAAPETPEGDAPASSAPKGPGAAPKGPGAPKAPSAPKPPTE